MTRTSPCLLNIRQAVDGIVCLQLEGGLIEQEVDVRRWRLWVKASCIMKLAREENGVSSRLKDIQVLTVVLVEGKRWPEEWADLSTQRTAANDAPSRSYLKITATKYRTTYLPTLGVALGYLNLIITPTQLD